MFLRLLLASLSDSTTKRFPSTLFILSLLYSCEREIRVGSTSSVMRLGKKWLYLVLKPKCIIPRWEFVKRVPYNNCYYLIIVPSSNVLSSHDNDCHSFHRNDSYSLLSVYVDCKSFPFLFLLRYVYVFVRICQSENIVKTRIPLVDFKKKYAQCVIIFPI